MESKDVVMTSVADEIVSVKLTDCVSLVLLESVALNVSGTLFAVTVGVPLIAPVLAFRDHRERTWLGISAIHADATTKKLEHH